MSTPVTNASESNSRAQDRELRNDKADAPIDEFDIEVRELQRPVRPRGVLAE